MTRNIFATIFVLTLVFLCRALQHCSRQARTSVQPSFCKLTYFSNLRPKFANSTAAPERETKYILHRRNIKDPTNDTTLQLSMLLLTLNSTHDAFIMCQEGNCCLQCLCRISQVSRNCWQCCRTAAVSRVLQAPTHIQCSHPGTRPAQTRQTVVPVPACVSSSGENTQL